MEKIGTVLWGIWFSRNKKIWDEKIITPNVTLKISSKMVVEWQEANRRKHLLKIAAGQALDHKDVRWKPPESGHLKVNVNASVYTENTSFSLGMLVRDDQGKFIAGKTMRIGGKVSVMEAEARGVQEACKWVKELQMQNVMIECDSESVVNVVHGKGLFLLKIGHVIEYCRERFRLREDISICHIKKQANMAVHVLARVQCLLDIFNYFMSPPNLLLEMLPSEFQS